ncbi:MAG: HAD-IG family 5'-nucleotidase [Bdellovibrionales bacterium]
MNQVFVNRTLNLKRINYIGLDMDHTLIRYNSDVFEALAHQVMLEKLVREKKYPASIANLKFSFDRAIRGLVIDKQRGNVLKLSRYAAIRVSYHGLQPIDFNTQKSLYSSTYIDLSDSQYDKVDTSFSIAFAGLFMQLVELKKTTERNTLPDFNTIATDLNEMLDQGHRDGSLKNVVRSKLQDFIIKDPASVQGLERYVKHGKKIFIVTNSDYSYTKLLLDYAINPFLKEHDSWSDLFEFVITSAQKPRFFVDKLKFLKINTKDGSMTNHEGPLTKGVYQGGCATALTNDLKLNADEILYIGDHIYGDIVRLKKDCAWRTALVVEELGDEIEKNRRAEPTVAQINALMDLKLPIERKIDELISRKIEQGDTTLASQIEKHLDEINDLDRKVAPLIQSQQKLFNPYWGEVMRVGIEESYFAYQVERFACVYMSKLGDLLDMSPRTYFRSPKRLLPHEMNSSF